MGGGYRGAQRRRRCVPEWTARTTVWCRAGWKVSVPGRELSRGVAEGTVLPLGYLAHEVRNLPEPSVALRIPALLKNTQDPLWVQCVCRAGPMAVRRAN